MGPPADDKAAGGTEGRTSLAGLVAWLLYDFASNSYAAIVLTFLFVPYFTQQIAPDETTGQIYWGAMLGVAGILVGIGGPIAQLVDSARNVRR